MERNETPTKEECLGLIVGEILSNIQRKPRGIKGVAWWWEPHMRGAPRNLTTQKARTELKHAMNTTGQKCLLWCSKNGPETMRRGRERANRWEMRKDRRKDRITTDDII